jgi:hypothetical protein
MKNLITLLLVSLFSLHASPAQQGIIQLPATGQTTSYFPGDDGDLQIGIPIPGNRFIDNGDSSITDSFTGLMWAKDANLMATRDPNFDQDHTPGDGDINWKTALEYIQKLNQESYLGYDDWRMPNYLELLSLVNLGNVDLALPVNHPFINLKAGYYSSTTNDRLRGSALVVYLQPYVVHANTTFPPGHWESIPKNLDGVVPKYYDLFLLPVRGSTSGSDFEVPQTGQQIRFYEGDDASVQEGEEWPSPRLVDNKDGSVTDRLTGLMWGSDSHILYTRDPAFDTVGVWQGAVPWTMALDYIAKLNGEQFLGHEDWRLPNRHEMASLIDYSRNEPCIPQHNPFTTTYPDAQAGEFTYWSSTTLADSPDSAWCFTYGLSNLYTDDKDVERAVWPVRTDTSPWPSGSIHGYILGDSLPKKDIEVSLEGPVKARTGTNANGYYAFTGLPDGSYTVTPAHEYFDFTPSLKTVAVSDNAKACDFEAEYNRAYGWVDISSNLFPVDDFYSDGLSFVFFVNEDTGWVASTQDIYYTTDGGQTFEKQTLPINGDYGMSIYMFDANHGYIGGKSGYIYKTENGGNDWTLFGSTGTWVLDIDFPPGSTTGYCCGESGSFWEISPNGLTKIETGLSGTMIGVSCPSIGNTFVSAGNSRLYLYDGNELSPACILLSYVGGIHFHNDTMGWSAQVAGIGGLPGEGIFNCGLLMAYELDEVKPLNDVHSPNGKDVWVVGFDGTIFYSPNAHDFWFDFESYTALNNTLWLQQAGDLTNEPLISVYFTSPTCGFASGANGILLKYTTLPGAPGGADILGIHIAGQIGEAEIDKENSTVQVQVSDSIAITRIVPKIFISAGASIHPPSGTARDFSTPQTYTVTSSDNNTKTWTVSIEQVLGVEDHHVRGKDALFRIYPNPCQETLVIQRLAPATLYSKLSIMDLSGQLVYAESGGRMGNKEVSVDISHLPPGLYLVKLQTDKGVGVQKIMKQ